jgi:hypothetical protein
MSGFAYNFQPRFAPLIKAGAKLHTIRAPRRDKRVPTPGDPLSLWIGQRTEHCELLLRTECTNIEDIMLVDGPGLRFTAFLNGLAMQEELLAVLAYKDGFTSIAEFRAFMQEKHGFPFSGYLIHWLPPQPPAPASVRVH